MSWLMDILRGAVIGIANIIPGVSGGTMAVSMGIYDKFIHAVTNLFKKFKQSILTLLPLGIGMLIGILGFASLIKWLLGIQDDGSTVQTLTKLPTVFAFIGLILGGLPAVIRRMSVKKAGVSGGILFILFFALIIILPYLQGTGDRTLDLSVGSVVTLILVGALASATMVVPGVSGSMVLMLIGYYNPVINALSTLKSAPLEALGILLPFAVGVVIGIFSISKLIDVLFSKYPDKTYCAILGLVFASPIALVLKNADAFAIGNLWNYLACAACLCVGFAAAYLLSGEKKKA